MTGIEYPIIVTLIMMAFFYAGKREGKNESVKDVIEHTLDTLEKGGYISVIENEDGEKELVKIS